MASIPIHLTKTEYGDRTSTYVNPLGYCIFTDSNALKWSNTWLSAYDKDVYLVDSVAKDEEDANSLIMSGDIRAYVLISDIVSAVDNGKVQLRTANYSSLINNADVLYLCAKDKTTGAEQLSYSLGKTCIDFMLQAQNRIRLVADNADIQLDGGTTSALVKFRNFSLIDEAGRTARTYNVNEYLLQVLNSPSTDILAVALEDIYSLVPTQTGLRVPDTFSSADISGDYSRLNKIELLRWTADGSSISNWSGKFADFYNTKKGSTRAGGLPVITRPYNMPADLGGKIDEINQAIAKMAFSSTTDPSTVNSDLFLSKAQKQDIGQPFDVSTNPFIVEFSRLTASGSSLAFKIKGELLKNTAVHGISNICYDNDDDTLVYLRIEDGGNELIGYAVVHLAHWDFISSYFFTLSPDSYVPVNTTAFTVFQDFSGTQTYKGSISQASEFPTAVSVRSGWTYDLIYNVGITEIIDNDPSKTNTGQTFLKTEYEGSQIAWNGLTWSKTGGSGVTPEERARWETAYSHSQEVSGNPHNVNNADIGLSNVQNVDQTNADNLISGEVNDARLSNNIFKKNVDTTTSIEEGTKLFYTEDKVTANSTVTANTAARHSHTNKAVLDAITDAGDGKIPTEAERNKWNAASSDLVLKGEINVPADFPTLAEVENLWAYDVKTNVTDNDPTKTNTGLSFLAGHRIQWTTGTIPATWLDLGASSVLDVNGLTGNVLLTTDEVPEGALTEYYTEAKVSANTDVAANTADRHTHANKTTVLDQLVAIWSVSNNWNNVTQTDNLGSLKGPKEIQFFNTNSAATPNSLRVDGTALQYKEAGGSYKNFLFEGDVPTWQAVTLEGATTTEKVGIGGAADASAQLKVTGDAQLTGDLELDGKINQTGSDLNFDISPVHTLRLGRDTNSSTFGVWVYRGDGVTTPNHKLEGVGDSTLCSNNGNLGIGGAAGSDKLTVAGSLNVKSSTGVESKSSITAGTQETRFFYRDSDNAFGIYYHNGTGQNTQFRLTPEGMELCPSYGGVGVRGLPESGYELKVHGKIKSTDDIFVNNDKVLTDANKLGYAMLTLGGRTLPTSANVNSITSSIIRGNTISVSGNQITLQSGSIYSVKLHMRLEFTNTSTYAVSEIVSVSGTASKRGHIGNQFPATYTLNFTSNDMNHLLDVISDYTFELHTYRFVSGSSVTLSDSFLEVTELYRS